MKISALRKDYHSQLCREVLRFNDSTGVRYANFSDVDNRSSVAIGLNIIKLMGFPVGTGKASEQTVGDLFEEITKEYIEECFNLLNHIRPGYWTYSTKGTEISHFEQYEHLALIEKKVKHDKDLSTALGRDYIVKPDIIIARSAMSDEQIDEKEELIGDDEEISQFTPLRQSNLSNPDRKILHASISCKWTIRSDRSQNTRTEALNLIRNRKGNLPHIVAVTAEPLPTRIATLALGTGDLDCVYHFALHELRQSVIDIKNEDQQGILEDMVNGKRLRDISDLPFDLAI